MLENRAERLIWTEGAFLGQQHFQQWDKQNAWQAAFWRQWSHESDFFGFSTLIVDKEALMHSRFCIQQAQGVFPSGQIFSYFGDAGPPLNLDLPRKGESPFFKDWHKIYLAIPKGDSVKGISGYPEIQLQKATWLAEYRNTMDQWDRTRRHEVLFGHLNLQLFTEEALGENEVQKTWDYLPLGKIRYRNEGRYEWLESYIPPLLQLKASDALITLLRNLETFLDFKLDFLKERLQEDAKNSNLASKGFAKTQFLMIILVELKQRLRHWDEQQTVYPGIIYQKLKRKFSEILALNLEIESVSELKSLTYHSLEINQCFETLLLALQTQIRRALPDDLLSFAFVEENEHLQQTEHLEIRYLTERDWYLEVFLKDAKPGWEQQWLKEVKLACWKDIRTVVAQALPGIGMTHPAAKIACYSSQKSSVYFSLEKKGAFWEKLMEYPYIGMYLPKSFRGAKARLLALRNGPPQ